METTVSECMPLEGGVVLESEQHTGDLRLATPNCENRNVQKEAAVEHIVPVVRKDIPAKKDRMEPLKIDMSKSIAVPLTSAQLSLQCLECHIIFSDIKSKERHVKHSHPAEYEQCMLGDALFACYVCDRHFTCSSELMAHQRAHTEKQPFKCPICGDAFSRSSELTIHKKVHFSSHGYTCSECGKPCKTVTLLKYHQRTHTGERPYVCKDCGKRFSMSKTLQKHRFLHSQDEMEGFNDGSVPLNPATSPKSIRKISDSAQCKPTFSCSLFNVTFKSAKTQMQHMKQKHTQSTEMICNNIIPVGEQPKEGPATESQMQTCETIQVLENMVTFEQGQALQVMETLGQEQMQHLIETFGHEESERQVPMVVPEQLQGDTEQSQGQKCSIGLELAQQQMVTVDQQLGHLKETDFEQLQVSLKTTELEQTQLPIETLEIQLTEDHMETVLLTPLEGHREGFHLEQINIMESEPVHVQADKIEDTQRQEESEELGQTHEQAQKEELEQRQMIPFGQTHGEIKMMVIDAEQGEVLESTRTQQENQEQHEEEQQQQGDTQSLSAEKLQQLLQKTPLKQSGMSSETEQQDQISESLSEIRKTEENSEHCPDMLLYNDNIQLIPLPTGSHNEDVEKQLVTSVNEEQQTKMKNTLFTGQPVNHSQSLQPEGVPKHKQKEKATHHVENQSVEKCVKHPRKGHLVVRFVVPKRGRKSKQKSLEVTKKQQNDAQQHYKEDRKETIPTTLKKLQLKAKGGKEKIKKQGSVDKHSQPLLREGDLQMPKALPKTEQLRRVQSKRELQQLPKDVCEKQSKRKKGQEQLLDEMHKKKRRNKESHIQLKNEQQMVHDKRMKKQQKLKEQKGDRGASGDQEQITKSLLLLKGHKQPQLKVHKLDPQKTSRGLTQPAPCQSQAIISQKNNLKRGRAKNERQERTKQIMPRRKRQTQTTKTKQDQQEDILSPSLLDQSSSSPTLLRKSRATRKRRASMSGIPEKAYRSTMPRLSLRCEYCGETFSDVLALRKHMPLCSVATGPSQGSAIISDLADFSKGVEENPVALSSEQVTRQTTDAEQDMANMNGNGVGKIQTLSNQRGDGVKVVGIAASGADHCFTLDLIQNPKSDKHRLGVHSDNYRIQATADWDMEVEIGEIGLGERVSFPALNPSPSLPLVPSCLEGESQGGREENGRLNVDGCISVADISTCLGTSESGHSQKSVQQGEELVKNQEGLKDTVNESRQEVESNRIEEMESPLQPEDVQPPIVHSHISSHVSKSSQVKIYETNDHCISSSPSLETHPQILQQTGATNKEAQMEGEELKLQYQKSNKEVRDSIPLAAPGEPQSVTAEEIKEELFMDVDLVTVGDESMENRLGTRENTSLTTISQTAHNSTESSKHSQSTDNSNLLEHATNIKAAVITSDTGIVSCTTDYEVKQEEEEIEVERKENGRKRLLRGRRKRTIVGQKGSKQSTVPENCMKETEAEMVKDGCQVVLEVHSITDSCQIKEEQVDFFNPSQKLCTEQNKIGSVCDGEERASISESCLPASLKESSDEQLVFELDSVTTSLEVLKEEDCLEGEPEKGLRSSQSPCVLLEQFLRGRERQEVDMERCQVEIRHSERMVDSMPLGFEVEGTQQHDGNGIILMESLRGQVIKVQQYSTGSCTTASVKKKKIDELNPCEKRNGVQVFLVKEEDCVINEPRGFSQHGHTELVMGEMEHRGSGCLGTDATSPSISDQRENIEQDGVTGVSPLILNDGDGSEQCIFLQVKEEEREVELAPSQTEHGISVVVVSGGTRLDDQMDTCETEAGDQIVSRLHSGPFSSSSFWLSVPPACEMEQGVARIENCEVDGEQMKQTETQQTVYVSTEQELKNAQEITDFLLQNSDVEESELSISDSELEDEAFVMACYHGNRKAVIDSDKSPSKQHDCITHSFPAQSEDAKKTDVGHEGGGKGVQTPIEYFRQYLDWDTWEEIVNCNTDWPDFANTVTAKEVAQFVGIHIAMGTLKFPDMRLYWQDLTRVPLIADAMAASRFFQLASKLRVGHRARDSETPTDTDLVGTSGNRNRTDGDVQSFIHIEGPARTSALTVHAAVPEIACNLGNSDMRTHSVVSGAKLDDGVKGEKPVIVQPSSDITHMPSLHQPGAMKTKHIHHTPSPSHNVQKEMCLSDITLQPQSETHNPGSELGVIHNAKTSENICETKNRSTGSEDPLWRVRALLERVRAGCLALNREGNHGVDEYPIHLGRPIRRKASPSTRPTLNCAVLVGASGLILDFNLNADDSKKEDVVEKMVPRNEENGERAVFLCKEELSTPAVVEHLLSAGVRSAARVGGVKGGIGNEFVSSDGKLTLFRCAQGFVLSTLRKRHSSTFSIVEEFERAQKVVRLNRELLSLYRTPLSASSLACWPQSVLWHLTDMVLVNSWLQYRLDHHQLKEPMKLMTFRLEVAKALILSNASNSPSSTPPPPAPELHRQETVLPPSPTPYPTAHTPDEIFRYDGLGHWPEQLLEGEGGKCRFGGCDRTSRVRCLKCCVFLCISQNNNCFLKFHCKERV